MFQIKSFLLDCTSGPGFGEYYTQIKRSLLSPALLSPAIKQKISNLNKIITEDDNNIILIGKLKESLLNSIEK